MLSVISALSLCPDNSFFEVPKSCHLCLSTTVVPRVLQSWTNKVIQFCRGRAKFLGWYLTLDSDAHRLGELESGLPDFSHDFLRKPQVLGKKMYEDIFG